LTWTYIWHIYTRAVTTNSLYFLLAATARNFKFNTKSWRF